MKDKPSLADLEAAAQKWERTTKRLKLEVEEATELVVVLLENGHKPTEVAKASKWTPAYVRKIARENGIAPDPRYAGRATRIRKPQ